MIGVGMTPIVNPGRLLVPEGYHDETMAMARWFWDNPEDSLWDEESEITLSYPFAGQRGPVQPHTDDLDGRACGKLVFGWVIHSDGHLLHSDRHPDGQILQRGAVYVLDPYDRHWTTCPTGDSEIVFAAAFMGPDDPRFYDLDKIMNDLFWDGLKSQIDFKQERERQRKAFDGIVGIGTEEGARHSP